MPTVNLTPIGTSDYAALTEWRNSDEFLRLCAQQTYKVDAADFRKELELCFLRDRHWQSIIRNHCGEPIGTIFSYNYSVRDAYCFVTIFLARERSLGLGFHAVIDFANALFSELNLHKVYMDVHEYNAPAIIMLRKAGLALEGSFKGHRLLKGKRYDTFRFALYKTKLEEISRRYSKRRCPARCARR